MDREEKAKKLYYRRESETCQESMGLIGRGSGLKREKFQPGATGLHRGSCFQATGESCIYFVSKKLVYADNIVGKAKKIRLNNGEDVYIYVDAEHTRGIRVRFGRTALNFMD